MKKLFTYYFSVGLSLCILLAGAGVPVFAHFCTINNQCLEYSVLPVKSCCAEKNMAEKSDDGCVKAKSCCDDQMRFFKADLSAVKFSTSHLNLLPALFAIVVYSSNSFPESKKIVYSTQKISPPLPSGRVLLANIQLLRI